MHIKMKLNLPLAKLDASLLLHLMISIRVVIWISTFSSTLRITSSLMVLLSTDLCTRSINRTFKMSSISYLFDKFENKDSTLGSWKIVLYTLKIKVNLLKSDFSFSKHKTKTDLQQNRFQRIKVLSLTL